MNKMNLFLAFLAVAAVTTGCEMPPQPIMQTGTLLASGKLDQDIFEENGYQLCFDLTLDKAVSRSSSGVETQNNDGKLLTSCRPFFTSSDGSYEIAFNYHLITSSVRLSDGTFEKPSTINITAIEAYVLSSKLGKDINGNSTTVVQKIDAVITGSTKEGSMNKLSLSVNVNPIQKTNKNNNVNVNINQH